VFKQTQVNDKMNKQALDVTTGILVLPQDASKTNNYICPQCQGRLILKKGAIMRPHFSHYANGLCNYFGTTKGESYLHKEAKTKLVSHLSQFKTLNISFRCHYNRCLNSTNSTILLDDTDTIMEEYRDLIDKKYVADVAVLNNRGTLKYIFEVRKTHSTENKNETRPEPWFEFQASAILEELTYKNPTLECIRNTKRICHGCKIILENPWLHQLPNYKNMDPCIICGNYQYIPIFIGATKQICKICVNKLNHEELIKLKQKYDRTNVFLEKNLTRLKELRKKEKGKSKI